jgi:CubicO group peptidase (beta-lactamase class C family)
MTAIKILATALCLLASGTAFADDPLPRAKPEDVGLSSERLARISATLKADIEAGRIPGAVIAIARHGKLVALDAYGWRDKAAGVAMTTDTIFNIASMTKPMTAVGALMLYEQGKILIDDPLSKYFPKFAQMRVAARDADGEPTADTVPANRQITIQDLMRHTSGIIYGGRGNTLVHKMYPAGSGDASRDYDGAAFMDKLASLPLLYQPATVWDYGFGLDMLGLTIEQISKQTLGQYLQANLFAPLGMTDTGFSIPPDKAARYARPLPVDPDTGKAQERSPELTQSLKFECGGCAASTASDYLRFAMMLMNGGRSGEARLLGRKTVDYMLSDQLGPNIKNLVGKADPTRADYGFGLGLAVRTTPGVVRMMGSVGQFSWPGASGTDWWVDPREELAVVYLSAAPGPIRWHYRQKINALVYQAIIE